MDGEEPTGWAPAHGTHGVGIVINFGSAYSCVRPTSEPASLVKGMRTGPNIV